MTGRPSDACTKSTDIIHSKLTLLGRATDRCRFDWQPRHAGRRLWCVTQSHQYSAGQSTLRDLARIAGLVGQVKLDAATEPEEVCKGIPAGERPAGGKLGRDPGGRI
jgi:hypothetical protein